MRRSAPSVSGSGCRSRVSAEAGSPDSGCAVSEEMRAVGADAGSGVPGPVLGVICTRKTFSSPGRAVVRRRFTQGVSPAKASPAGAARSRAGRRSHSGIVCRLLENHQPAAAAISARAIAANATGSHDLPLSRTVRCVVVADECSVRVGHRVSAGVRRGQRARPVWSRSGRRRGPREHRSSSDPRCRSSNGAAPVAMWRGRCRTARAAW